jgi:hypothetical protein
VEAGADSPAVVDSGVAEEVSADSEAEALAEAVPAAAGEGMEHGAQSLQQFTKDEIVILLIY